MAVKSLEKKSSRKQKKSKHKINERNGIGTTAGKVATEQPKYGQITEISYGPHIDQPKSKKQQVNPLADCHLLFLHKLVFHVNK